MENLQDFILLFRMTQTDNIPSPTELANMEKQWTSYIGTIAANARLVATHRLGYEGGYIENNGEVKSTIYSANNEIISGHTIIKAVDLNEANGIAKKCPILNIGGTVEVRTTIPMNA